MKGRIRLRAPIAEEFFYISYQYAWTKNGFCQLIIGPSDLFPLSVASFRPVYVILS